MEFEHIYEIVNNEELTYDELLFFYKKYLILKLKQIKSLPSYESDINYYLTNSMYTNCYAYALRLSIPQFFNENFYRLTGNYFNFIPGIFSYKKYPKNTKLLLDNLKSDLDSLEIKNIGYRVAVLSEIKVFDGERDFHFIRENICGNWSQKIGRSELIEKSSYIDVPNNYDLIKTLKI